MKKLIFLFIILTNISFAIGASDYRDCCASFNLTYDSQVGWAEDDEAQNFGTSCTKVGDIYEVTVDWRKAIVECTCGVEDTLKHEEPNKELIYDGDATLAPSECYEPQLPYTAYDYSEECLVKKVCYREVIQNCEETKGADWVYNSSSTADTCFDWVDEDTYDSADFTDNTCCLHETPDNNDTDPSPTPDPDATPNPDNCDLAREQSPELAWYSYNPDATHTSCPLDGYESIGAVRTVLVPLP